MSERLHASKQRKKTSFPDQAQCPALTVSAPGGWCEQRADRTARKVVPEWRADHNMSRSAAAAFGPRVFPAMEASIRGACGGGQGLNAQARAFFEPRFGHDFSRVRVHADTEAAGLSRALDARAFTLDQDVFFGARAFAPQTSAGLNLLAHELAHTLQSDPQSVCEVRRQTAGEDLFGPTQEACRADAMKMQFEYILKKNAASWREEMRQRLGVTLEPWAEEALGHLTGSPYAGAEKIYGKHDIWRNAYRNEGKYPAAMVCDQLGDVTQRLFRGTQDYGNGLLGHYAFYQEKDPVFSSAVPDDHAIPEKYDDERCAPGATLFNISAPDKDREFMAHAMFLLLEKEGEKGHARLFDNGVPRKGKRHKEAIGEVKSKAKALRPKMQELDKVNPGANTEEKQEILDELIDVMGRNFYDDKWIKHEYTVLAVLPPVGEDKKGKLLMLDTFGNERAGGKSIYGAAQPHWSSLKTLSDKGCVYWGFYGVEPRHTFSVASLPEGETDVKAEENENPAAPTSSDDAQTTLLVPPCDRVVMNIIGKYETHSFDIEQPFGSPPPAVAYAYALEKLTSIRDFKIWLEFYGPAQGKETQLKELWLEEQGEAVWHRPFWMTEKYMKGDLTREKKAMEKFFGKAD